MNIKKIHVLYNIFVLLKIMIDYDEKNLTKTFLMLHKRLLPTVVAGCAVDGSCKRVDSYWHDGCTVYTCEGNAGNADKRMLSNGEFC